MNKGISVIICCFNSAARLPQTLKHLAVQQVAENFNWEILIVNNASTDNTTTVAESEWAKYRNSVADFRIIDQPVPGVSYAREKGVEQAKFEYLIFCDDDNWLDEHYIANSFRIMESDARIGALGGRAFKLSDVEFPDWFDDFADAYVVGDQTQVRGYITSRKYLWGAGMITRKQILEKVFNKKFPIYMIGRKGKQLTAGEDVEICARIVLLGYELFYDPELTFHHFISSERLTWDYKTRLYEGFTMNNDIVGKYWLAIDFGCLPFGRKTKVFLKQIKMKVVKQIFLVDVCDIMGSYRNLLSIYFNYGSLTKDAVIRGIITFKKKAAEV